MAYHAAKIVFGLTLSWAASAMAGPIPIDLGTAASFGVLAGADVTSTGSSVINGNLGVWPGTSITGFPPGIVVNGTVYDGDATAMQAQADALAAYTGAAAITGAQSLTGQDLGGMDLVAGVYSFSSSAQLTGTLTLNAGGAANAVFIFQIGSTLTTAANSLISIVNGQTAEIIWQVGSSATLGVGSQFDGDIIALTDITMDTNASISCGGALALNGAVTMQANDVSTSGASCNPIQTNIPEPRSLLMLAGCSMFLGVGKRFFLKKRSKNFSAAVAG